MNAKIKNNIYMLKIAWKICKGYILFSFFRKSVVSSISITYGILLMKIIIDALSDRRPFWFLLMLVLTYSIFNIFESLISNYDENIAYPKAVLKVSKHINDILINKAIL